MDPEDIPTGFPYADDEEKLEAALSCGPQCASNVLATRYAKILRQERLLAMAANSARHLEALIYGSILSRTPEREALLERSAAIRRQIDEERGNPA